MAFERQTRLKSIFEDTMYQITNNPSLKNATEKSMANTYCYAADEYPAFDKNRKSECKVTVTPHSTFEAARKLSSDYPGKKIAVLNFASATTPGGGVKYGSSAQEESLCRCSTLYPTLNQEKMWDSYYKLNRAEGNALHSDACIYSPGIIVFKSADAFPETLPEDEWFTVDVISCAAPNLREIVGNLYNPETGEAAEISDEELYKLHLRRAKHILTVAAADKVDLLVLGAFGCGAFANNPRVVARALFDALEGFKNCFDTVEFAIYCRSYETENYKSFLNAFEARQS